MINMRVKSVFFDSKKVIASVDKTTRKVMSKIGAYVRRTARQSIRKRARSSPPGQQPSSHTGTLKRFIYFGWDPVARSVVVGPTLAGSRTGAPEALEHGGMSVVSTGRKARRVQRMVRIAARPYMQPAMMKEIPKLPAMWRDSVKP